MGLFVLGTGLIIFAVSLFFFPLVFITPYKFCALNSLGTFTIFVSIIVMRGPTVCASLLSIQKLPFTLGFFVTFAGELYFSIIKEKYFYVLIFFGLHLLSILYILVSYFPNGVSLVNSGLK